MRSLLKTLLLAGSLALFSLSASAQVNNSGGNGSAPTGPVTNQVYTAQHGSASSFQSPGVVGNAITSTPYTVQCDSSTTTLDRGTVLWLKSGASVVTVPDPTASGCTGGFIVAMVDDGAGTITVNRTTTAYFYVFTGATVVDTQTSFTLASGQYATLNSPDGANWLVRINSGGGIISGSPSAGQIASFISGSQVKGIDFPDVKFIPAGNCNNTTAGNAWSIGSGGTIGTCPSGSNNLGTYMVITDSSATFATFQIPIPEDWDSSSDPFIRFEIASTDTTSGHTIIPSIQIGCYKGDGSTTDNIANNAAHSLSTVTLNSTARQFWTTSNIQMNSTDMTGCVAGSIMQITVGRATDTATNAEFYGATITFNRLLSPTQAN